MIKRYRVLINGLTAKKGGGPTHLKAWLKEPLPKELEVYLLAPPELQIVNSNIKRIPTSTKLNHPLKRMLWEYLVLPYYIWKFKIDLVFNITTNLSFLPFQQKVKQIIMFRNMAPLEPRLAQMGPLKTRLRLKFLKNLYRRNMRSSKKVIFLSEFAKQQASKVASMDFDQHPIIPHGISSIFFDSSPNVLDWLPSKPYWIYVSSFDFYKNHLEVIDAYYLLKQERIDLPPLLFVGPPNNLYYQKVLHKIHAYGLENEIIVKHEVPHEDLPTAYKNASLILFCSTCENCPNILLEAMASGQPILCSELAPMTEFGQSSVYYCDPFNPLDIASQLKNFLNPSNKSSPLSVSSQELAQQYSWQKTASKTWQVVLQELERS